MRALVVAVLVVLAGCTIPAGLTGEDVTSETPVAPDDRADPDSDRLGWENGYWYDEPLSVTTEDGLNESEREAAVARAMARVERIRRLEFEESVPVEVISRSEYQSRNDESTIGEHELWNNQVWEALFLVGEDTDVTEAFNATLGTSVQGYYSASEDEIVLVSDAPRPTVSRTTLAHELVHALQDQHFGLNGSQSTQDRQLAYDGIVEGDATAVQRIYTERCGDRWRCLPVPDDGSTGRPPGYNQGVFLTVYQPYATGGSLVATVRERSGWSGVNDVYANLPASTEQVIHPEKYPDEQPVNVTVPDRSTTDWQRFDVDPEADTVGEASIYAMLVTNGVSQPDGSYYGYVTEASAGWGGDAVVPYRNDGRYGYVWQTTWDTRRDADQFADAYRTMLSNRYNATEVRSGVYVIDDDSRFGDAFRVTFDGKRVRVVNAPTVAELDAVHDPDRSTSG